MRKPSASSLLLFGFSLGLVAPQIYGAALGSAVFSDVPSGAYYDAAVGEMYADGIITGYGDGRFGPDDFVTRGQVAVMMQRFKNGGVVAASSSSRTRASSSSSTSSSSSVSEVPNAMGAFRFTTGSFKIDELRKEITISVLRYGGTEGAVSVEYALETGTATAGTDYQVQSGTLNFADGDSTKSFIVKITDDAEKESDETLYVKLINPKNGATLGTPNIATLTILDDDAGATAGSTENAKGVFIYSASKYDVAEDAGSVTVTVNRISGTDGAVSVGYATENGTGNSSNYDPVNGTLEFGSGESSKSFTVTIKDVSGIGGNKTVNLKLVTPTGGAVLAGDPHSVLTIVDTDNQAISFGSGSIKLERSDYDATKGASLAVSITRTGGTKGQATVQFATQNGTAKAGTDFTETTGTLTFKEGEATKIVFVPIKSDATGSRQFSFKISNVSGAYTGATTSATVTIN